MDITLVCNAGLVFHHEEAALIVDAPNMECDPYRVLTEKEWLELCGRGDICGFFFTHDHPDHLDHRRLDAFLAKNPLPCFVPPKNEGSGKVKMGPFTIEYHQIEHAPIPDAPPHVVAYITAGENSVYLAADARLDVGMHYDALKKRVADVGIWNSMYLSRPDTRSLMKQAARRNYIYHMPPRPDAYGIWKKCDRNLERYSEELKDIVILDTYPQEILL